MDETLQYAVFGGFMIFSGCLNLYLLGHYHWKHSKQKAQIEYVKFWNHLEELGLDYKTIKEVADQMNFISDFERANKRLSKCLKHEPKL